MDNKHWQQIEELFHHASQLQGAARTDFLTSACKGDERLRREVNSLIAASERDGRFFEQPTFDLGIRILGQTGALAGQTIGHYQILRLLGEGGMGEVYLAKDTMLDRNVALKFLVTGLFDDHSAKDQLMREARAVAKLEHPNICAVYGLESIGKHDFIVMPYIEGETLATLLGKESPNLDRILELSEQMASALATAHSRGIIHRDIKPQNVIITEDGQAKILDFGLAKISQLTQGPLTSDSDLTVSQAGLVPGTIAYMSPEQARGEKVDCRTDIFSFGIVLFEMFTARNPFVRTTRAETISAIKNEDPQRSNDALPVDLKQVVGKCLAKARDSRYANGEELLIDVRRLRRRREQSVTIAWHRTLKVVGLAACVLLLAVLVAGSWAWRRATKIHTLAIVPVTNLSGKSGNDYLSVGLTRSLFDKLSGLPKLKVRLPSAVPANAKDPEIQAGRDLAVEAVLAGDVVEQNGELQLRVRLLNTANGKSMWERTFELRSIDMLAVQDAVATNVTSALGMWLSGNEKKLLARHQTDSQDALNAYMRGRQHWSVKRDMPTAIKFFDQAIDLDPSFAEAYAGRADCYVIMPTVLYGTMPTAEAMEKAKYNARKALEINPLLTEAHTSLGTINLRYNWNWAEAEKEFKTAIDLNPDYGPAHFYYSLLLAVLGRFDESISESAKAKSLDPDSPTAALNYSRALYLARRNDEAEKIVRKLMQDWPDSLPIKHTAAWVFMQQEKPDEAIPLLEEVYARDQLYAAASLGYAYGRVGRYKNAEEMLHFLETYPKPVPSHERAIIYIGMRDWEHAFELLNKDCEERFSQMSSLGIDPLYDPLRADPRFTELMRCANLTQ